MRLFSIKSKKASSFDEALVAESEGFEPPVPCGTIDFKSITFDHSDNSPKLLFILFSFYIVFRIWILNRQ